MFFSSFFSLSLSTLKMTDAPGQGAERAAAANVGTCNDVPPQASGRGGGQEEEVRLSTNRHQCSCRCWLAFFFFSMLQFSLTFFSRSLSPSLSPRNAQGVANGLSPPVALAWTGERRVKKPKKKKLLAEAMAKAGVDASATAATAATPTSTSSAQLAASVYGEGARASVELRRERAIRLEDVQNLVLWVLAEGSSPRWAFVKVREVGRGKGRRERALGRRRCAASLSLSLSPSLTSSHTLFFAHSLHRTRP